MSPHVTNLPVSAVPAWSARHPWLHAGTTRRRPDGQPDFRLFASADSAGAEVRTQLSRSPADDGGRRDAALRGPALDNWRALLASSGCESVVHARQVHGTGVHVHQEAPQGFSLAGDGDGHATDVPGLLLAVAAADCAPVFLADPVRRAVAVLHAGWRGTAAGVVEAGVQVLCDAFQSAPPDLLAHVGPAIGPCCYEVGPEVLAALETGADPAGGGLPGVRRPVREAGSGGRPFLDVGAVVHARLLRLGLARRNISRNPECTRCDPGFFSHRGGDRGRHVAFACIGANRSRCEPGAPPSPEAVAATPQAPAPKP